MELKARNVDALLAASYGILEDKGLAFRGRLDHLRKLGCPEGVKVGKGRAAKYGWAQMIELRLALELIDLGLRPDHAVAIVTHSRGAVMLRSADLVSNSSDEVLRRAVVAGKWPAESTIFMLAGLNSLGSIGLDLSAEPLTLIMDGSALAEWQKEGSALSSAAILLNLGDVVASVISFAILPLTLEVAISEFKSWGEAYRDEVTKEVLHGLSS